MGNILTFLNENFWLVAAMISSITLPVTTAINSKVNPNKVWKQVIAWVTSITLTVGAYFIGAATFNEPVWLSIPATGIVCGLSANGIYDIPTIKTFINSFVKK